MNIKEMSRWLTQCKLSRIALLSGICVGSQLLPSGAQTTSSQSPVYQWLSLTIEDQQKFRYILETYELGTTITGVLVNDNWYATLIPFERDDFCRGDKCLTVVVPKCGRKLCPYTSVISTKEFNQLDVVSPVLGGSRIITFKAASDISINVISARHFIAAWAGFGG